MKYLVVLFAFMALQGAFAMPRAEAPKDSIQELADNAKKLAETVAKQIGLEDLDSKKVGKALTDGTTSFLTTLEQFIDKVKEESKAHEGDVKDAFAKVETKLSETAADLHKSLSPEGQAKATEVKNNLNKAFKDAADQINQLINDPKVKDAQSKVQSYSEQFYNEFIDLGKKIDKGIKDAVADHEKTH